MPDIMLGCIVRDKITGLEGMFVSVHDYLHGMTQYAIQPRGDGKAIPESWTMDPFTLEYVDAGLSGQAIPPDENIPFKLGDQVRDRVTLHSGTIIEMVTYLNGCTRVVVVGKKIDKDNDPKIGTYDWKRIEALDAPPVLTAKSEKGGPSFKAQRM